MPTAGLKREAPAQPSATPDSATKRFRDCHSSDCSSSSACSSPTSDTADYECCICLGLLVDPVVGQCGHDFCKSCLEEWRDRTSSSGRAGVSCPVCRQQVMAPGVQSLGVCVRLQRLIERQYPEQLQQRRSEVAAAVAERSKAKQREVQEQVASIQDIMRARFSRVAHILGPEQDAPAAAHRPMSSNASSPTAAFSPSYVYSSPTFSAINQQVPMLPLFSGQPQPSLPVFACVQSQQPSAALTSIPQASSWQSPARDAELRQSTIETLVQSFTARRPNMDETFRRRLPSLVRKLEEVLYRTARSQEEYCNAQLLQARVQAVVRQLTERRAERRAQQASPPVPLTSGVALMVQPLLWTPMVAPTVAVGLPVHQFIGQAVGPMAL